MARSEDGEREYRGCPHRQTATGSGNAANHAIESSSGATAAGQRGVGGDNGDCNGIVAQRHYCNASSEAPTMKRSKAMGSSFRFCAVVLAVSVCGCTHNGRMPPPPPPNPHNIYLYVRASSGGNGYIDAPASNGVYSCKYTGGDNDGGDVTITEPRGNPGAVVVHLAHGDHSYEIGEFFFPKDPNRQLSKDVGNSNRVTAVIRDMNTMAQTAHYKIIVSDTNFDPPVSILCDPRIVNN